MPTARVTITELPVQAAAEDANEIPIYDAGTTKKMTVAVLLDEPRTGLANHLADATAAHAASAISVPAGTVLTGTDVQAQLAAADTAIQTNSAAVAAHLADAADAHDASAISFVPTGTIAATDVQAAIAEVATEAASAGAVDSIVAGAGIDVDATDPENPEVALTTAAVNSLALADSALQPADIPATIVESVVAGDGIEVDDTDAANPIVSLEYPTALTATADTVALRGASGVVTVGTPTLAAHAATKQYVDDSISGGGLTEAVADDLYARLDGTNLMVGDPVDDLDVATKQYVDDQVATRLTSAAADTAYVNVGGDTMTGFLVLHADPDAAMKAATKQYVDAEVAAIDVYPELPFTYALSDETTALTTGDKLTVRAPFGCTVEAVRASLTTASGAGAVTVDIEVAGVSMFSTPLTIDASERTSTTAATPAVISDDTIADDAEIVFVVTGAGSGATGLKVTLYLQQV